MAHHCLPIPVVFLVMTILLVGTQAAAPAEVYWRSVFPDTPMPIAIKSIIRPGAQKDDFDAKWATANEGSLDEEHFHADSAMTMFFLPNDMRPDTKMTLKFDKNEHYNNVPFMPLNVSDSIPFSSKKFPAILERLSIKPESIEAKTIKKTLEMCEEPEIKGEEKICATSLESMIDFTKSRLGKNVRAITTEVQSETSMLQRYRITIQVKLMGDDKLVVCHKMKYPYVVFKCHTLPANVYKVPLEGADGSRVKALLICHKDTAAWNPNHLAFKLLGVKPGTTPICHVLGENAMVWVR